MKHRVQLDFADKPFEELTILKEEIGAKNYTETISHAISAYMFLVNAKKTNSKIILETKTGKQK